MNDKDVLISKKALLDLIVANHTELNGVNVVMYSPLYKDIQQLPPATPYVLADMLMEERIRGELKQNMSCSREVIDNVRCKLTVEIIDRRPCFCGAELREVWREEKQNG